MPHKKDELERARRFRYRAEELRMLADECVGPDIKHRLLNTAGMWDEMADKIESRLNNG